MLKVGKQVNIMHPMLLIIPTVDLSRISIIIGKAWLTSFKKRHPEVALRQPQHLNEARAQKMNKPIVADYFEKLRNVMTELDIMNKPEKIFNMDEKGIQMSLHKSPKVLTTKGKKRNHVRGKEHGENVTVVAAGSAVGFLIPPMILFKGVRKDLSWVKLLPTGSAVEMTPKGCMNIETFVKYLDHFAKYKPTGKFLHEKREIDQLLSRSHHLWFIYVPGKCLFILDGAKCHFDISIVTTATSHDIELLCLPSNTTHKLQPLDKTLFGPLEKAWNDEVLTYWERDATRTLNKLEFCSIFSKAWARAATSRNVVCGFQVCGIYPYDPNRIREEAYAPSLVTHQPVLTEEAAVDEVTLPAVSEASAVDKMRVQAVSTNAAAVDEIFSPSNISTPTETTCTFKMLTTPKKKLDDKADTKKPRKKALNYKAVRMNRDLFEVSDDVSDDILECDEPDEVPTHEAPTPKIQENKSYVIAFLIFDFGTKKEVKKYYVGKVKKVNVGRNKKQIAIDFLRRVHRKESTNVTGFSFPNIADPWKIGFDQIVQILPDPHSERRGRIFFENDTIMCPEPLQ